MMKLSNGNEIDLSTMSLEELQEISRRSAYRAFRAKILRDAESIIEDFGLTKENLEEKQDGLYERICEEVDCAVTYYNDCHLIVFACDTDEGDEIFDHMGNEALNNCESTNEAIGKIAYWAYHRALTDCINSKIETD